MAEIDVACEPEDDSWTCGVEVREGGSATRHVVRLSADDRDRLAPGARPEELVRRSFEFLLAREPKESILRSFDLPAIARFFPDYEEWIRAA